MPVINQSPNKAVDVMVPRVVKQLLSCTVDSLHYIQGQQGKQIIVVRI